MNTSSPTETVERLRENRREVYRTGKIVRQDGREVDVWPVGLTDQRGEALLMAAMREQARSCIETGMAYGMSTSYLLEAVLRNPATGHDVRSAVVTSVDPFEESVWGNAGLQQIKKAGASAWHRLHDTGSEIVLPQLFRQGERFDFAFIDGDHRFEFVFIDIFFLRKLVGHDKLIVVDDAWMPSVQKACRFYASAGLCRLDESCLPEKSGFVGLRVVKDGESRDWDSFRDF